MPRNPFDLRAEARRLLAEADELERPIMLPDDIAQMTDEQIVAALDRGQLDLLLKAAKSPPSGRAE